MLKAQHPEFELWNQGVHGRSSVACAAGAGDAALQPALSRQRKAQWRLDFIAAENSMGLHATQEAARVLAAAIDEARQGEIAALEAVAALAGKR